MSIFKQINSSDISIKNFPLYKQWNVTYNSSSGQFENNINSIDVTDKITIFDGQYQNYPMGTIIPAIAGIINEVTTSLSFTKRSIYDFVNGMYNKPIRNSNEFNFVLDDPINNLRELYQNVSLLKIHQDLYGYSIKKSSLQITSRTNDGYYVEFDYVDPGFVEGEDGGTSIVFKDDGEGNLYDIANPEANFLDNQNRVLYLSFTKKYKSYDNNGILALGLDTWRTGALDEIDESYFQNEYEATNIYYRTGSYGIAADFISGSMKIPDDFGYNLDSNSNFGISFIINPGESSSYPSSIVNVIRKGYQKEQADDTIIEDNRYPYGISYNNTNKNIIFSVSDGLHTYSVTSSINTVPHTASAHIICQKVDDVLNIYVSSSTAFTSSSANCGCMASASNKCPIFIGSNPQNTDDKFKGTLEQISFFDNALSLTERTSIFNIPSNIWQLGKVFYSHGIVILTNPQLKYTRHLNLDNEIEILNVLYKSTKYISETEYICRIKSTEYNYTYNNSIPKYKQESCATGSSNIYDDPAFNPYITTIGLYNDQYELIAVAKLAAPIQVPPNHDLNFAVNFDI